jgi:hypothetical protein
MSLEETSKLLTESRQVTEDSGNNVEHFHILFNMVLRIVTSIDTRLKSIVVSNFLVKNVMFFPVSLFFSVHQISH